MTVTPFLVCVLRANADIFMCQLQVDHFLRFKGIISYFVVTSNSSAAWYVSITSHCDTTLVFVKMAHLVSSTGFDYYNSPPNGPFFVILGGAAVIILQVGTILAPTGLGSLSLWEVYNIRVTVIAQWLFIGHDGFTVTQHLIPKFGGQFQRRVSLASQTLNQIYSRSKARLS